MGHYSPNPHYAPDNFSQDDKRREEALEISGRWFRDATKPQTARYNARMAAIRPYVGTPEWEREREAAWAEFKASTEAAAALCNETYREVYETGEVSDANAALIAEAGTVVHETGLTPRQFEERCKELLAALERISALTPGDANARDARGMHLHVKAIADCAIAKAQEGGAT